MNRKKIIWPGTVLIALLLCVLVGQLTGPRVGATAPTLEFLGYSKNPAGHWEAKLRLSNSLPGSINYPCGIGLADPVYFYATGKATAHSDGSFTLGSFTTPKLTIVTNALLVSGESVEFTARLQTFGGQLYVPYDRIPASKPWEKFITTVKKQIFNSPPPTNGTEYLELQLPREP